MTICSQYIVQTSAKIQTFVLSYNFILERRGEDGKIIEELVSSSAPGAGVGSRTFPRRHRQRGSKSSAGTNKGGASITVHGSGMPNALDLQGHPGPKHVYESSDSDAAVQAMN